MKRFIHSLILISTTLSLTHADKVPQDPMLYEPIPYKYRKLELSPSVYFDGSFQNQTTKIDRNSEDKSKRTRFQFETPFSYVKSSNNSLKIRDTRLSGSLLNFDVGSWSSSLVTDSGTIIRISNDSRVLFETDLRFTQALTSYIRPEALFTTFSYELDLSAESNGPINNGKTSNKDTTWYLNHPRHDSTYRSEVYIRTDDIFDQHATGDVTLSAGIGYGRRYDITYTAIAIHICNYLSDNQLLINSSKQSVVDISTLMEKLKRERVFDTRESKISHISQLCTMLEEEKISKELDSKNIMEILDLWDFSFTQKRYKGSPLSLLISGKLSTEYEYIEHSYQNIEFDTIHDKSTHYSKELLLNLAATDSSWNEFTRVYKIGRVFSPEVTYSFDKSIGMKSQLSLYANAKGGIIVEKEHGHKESTRYHFNSGIMTNYNIFPTVRSNIQLSTTLSYLKTYCNDSNSEYMNYDSWKVNAYPSFQYYISPKLSFTSGLLLSLNIHKETNKQDIPDKDISGYYQLKSSLQYQIF